MYFRFAFRKLKSANPTHTNTQTITHTHVTKTLLTTHVKFSSPQIRQQFSQRLSLPPGVHSDPPPVINGGCVSSLGQRGKRFDSPVAEPVSAADSPLRFQRGWTPPAPLLPSLMVHGRRTSNPSFCARARPRPRGCFGSLVPRWRRRHRSAHRYREPERQLQPASGARSTARERREGRRERERERETKRGRNGGKVMTSQVQQFSQQQVFRVHLS